MTGTIRMVPLCVIWFASVALAADKAPKGAGESSADKAAKALEVIKSNAPAGTKAAPCKVLAVYGGPEAVPSLAALLPDPELSSWARIPLEAIPGPEADAALRDAAGKLQGRLLIGVINSLGVRKDAKAVDQLTALMKGSDAEVASAAAAALGRIGGEPAAKALEGYIASAPAAVRSAVAEGCIYCAEQSAAAGKTADAQRLFELVRKADVRKQHVYEATRGLLHLKKADGAALLVEQLRSADKGAWQLGLRIARELPLKEIGDALAAELPKAAPDRQPQLLLVLADRGDAAAMPAVLAAINEGAGGLRVAAIRAVAKMKATGAAGALLDAAAGEGVPAAAAAVALASLPGKEVDTQIAARLTKAEGKARQVLIQLIGQRRIAACVPVLFKALDEEDADIRAAALGALGQTIEAADLPKLLAAAVTPKTPREAKPAADALKAAATRMPDRDGTIAALLAGTAQSPLAAKTMALEIITAMGGPKALAAVAAAAKSADPEMQDVGSRLLGDWMSADAAPVLLGLAKTADDKYKVRAVRGYIRIARQLDVPDAERVEMVRQALKVAHRDDERRLVAEVLRRVLSKDSLAVAVSLLDNPALKAEAGSAVVAIGEKLVGPEPAAVAQAMKRVLAANLDGDVPVRARTLLEAAEAKKK